MSTTAQNVFLPSLPMISCFEPTEVLSFPQTHLPIPNFLIFLLSSPPPLSSPEASCNTACRLEARSHQPEQVSPSTTHYLFICNLGMNCKLKLIAAPATLHLVLGSGIHVGPSLSPTLSFRAMAASF